MSRQFVTEAVMMAIYGQLLISSSPVEYIVPYTTVMELYELRDSDDPLMNRPDDDKHVKLKIGELIAYFEEPLNAKKSTVVWPFLGQKVLEFFSVDNQKLPSLTAWIPQSMEKRSILSKQSCYCPLNVRRCLFLLTNSS